MRGKRRDNDSVHRATRITPADAGKTVTRCNDKVPISDHPRGCGENVRAAENFDFSAGSPPRMRGKPDCRQVRNLCDWITPADAGKTTQSLSSGRSLRDHPRGCGENRHVQKSILQKIGSPPRMRGKLTANSLGKNAVKDHPRGCGENATARHARNSMLGSPPRMRGKRSACVFRSACYGITPADAGKTC